MLKRFCALALFVTLISAPQTISVAAPLAPNWAGGEHQKSVKSDQYPHIRAAIKDLKKLRATIQASPEHCDCVYEDKCYSWGASHHGQVCRCFLFVCWWGAANLKEARRELDTAAHDFAGHRKEAIEAVDHLSNFRSGSNKEKVEAIDYTLRQLEEALRYDKK